jgi:nucleoid DNA-binding protein
MNKNLDKDGFIRLLSEKTGYTLGDTKHFIDVLIDVFGECIVNEIQVDIRGFGKLYQQTIPEREGFKPIKGKKGEGEKMHYPETKRIIFKLAKNLRDLAKYELVEDDEEA